MRQITNLLKDKKFVTGSSALALALGMGTAPAHAALITYAFSSTQTDTLNSGGTVTFGPTGDTSGFSAYLSGGQGFFGEPATYLNLIGVGPNGVADLDGDTGCSSPSNSCKLRTYSPGSVVDGSANFETAGEFKTSDFFPMGTPSNGNYYFGLDDVAPSDPFGWAEITLNDGTVTLDRFAFEDNNTDPAPIPALPEPTPLSLLAVGAAAVLVLRRKKAQKQTI
jgi:hypothetical protein